MSQWEYERNREIVERGQKQQEIAEKYVRDCLEIMDGSVEAGMARIGTERFRETVVGVLLVLPRPKEKS